MADRESLLEELHKSRADWEAVSAALGLTDSPSLEEVLERIEMVNRAAGVILPTRLRLSECSEKVLSAMSLLTEAVHMITAPKDLIDG